MYLCGLRQRSSIVIRQVDNDVLKRTSRIRSSKHTRRPPIVHEPKRSYGSEGKTNRNGDKRRAARGSVRPITVFALCIPLGYAANWALKEKDGNASDTDGFIKYTLIDKEDVSSTCSIFTLQPTISSSVRTDDPTLKRVITSVQFKQPQLQIARSYTVLPPEKDQDPHELRFLIRKERNGEVSGYLHRLALGAEVELRGLSPELALPKEVDSVIFLAGGTGIAPAMQVAGALGHETDVHILWANRSRDDCVGGKSDTASPKSWSLDLSAWWRRSNSPSAGGGMSDTTTSSQKGVIVSRLEDLKHAANSTSTKKLRVDYYVDQEGSFISQKDVARLLEIANEKARKGGQGRKLLLVSGPDGFINYWAGGKQWANGREIQGPLRGALTSLDLRGWEVIKL